MTELFNSLKGLVTPELLAAMAAQLEEEEETVQKAVSAITLLLLVSLGKRAELPGGAPAILDLSQRVRQLMGATTQPGDAAPGTLTVAKMVAAGRGHDWATILLTTEITTEVIAVALADYARLPPDAATALLRLVVPAMLALLAQYTAANSLNSKGLTQVLLGLASRAQASLPGGLAPLRTRLGLCPPARPVAAMFVRLEPVGWPGAGLSPRHAPVRSSCWHW